MTMIKTWRERCEEHPDHEGIVTEQMIRNRMQEEIDELRQSIAEEEKREWVGLTGMTLRDYFAAKAMQGLFSCGKAHDEHTAHVTAKASYLMADAMLKAREA